MGKKRKKKLFLLAIIVSRVKSRIDSNPPVLPLEFELCSKSNVYFSTSLIKLHLEKSRANLLNIVAEGR